MKIEIFPLLKGYSSTTLWFKNSLEIALSLTVSEIFSMFYFPLKSKMTAKSGKNLNFSPRHRILLYYPVGQKFASNRSTSYHFQAIFNVLPNVFLYIGYSCTTLRVKNLLEIALSLTVFEIFVIFFHIFTKHSNKVLTCTLSNRCET